MLEGTMSEICLSVSATSVADMVTKIESHHGEVGMVELRVDHLNNPNDIKLEPLVKLLKGRNIKMIWTVRWNAEKGSYKGDEDSRLKILQWGDELGVDYVDVELCSGLVPKLKLQNAKKIISFHNFESCPPQLDELVLEMDALGADVAKIACAVSGTKELAKMLALYANRKPGSLVAIAMGEYGAVSRLLPAALGMPWTYAAPEGESGTAPGQYSVSELLELYRYPSIKNNTRRLAVIGNPVGHSLSPQIHNRHYIKENLDAVYAKIKVDDMEAFYTIADILGLDGVSVTVPHKEAIARFAPQGSYVSRIGAANTLIRHHGAWHIENSDIQAALAAITSQLDDHLKTPRVLLLGAGGVARALAFGMVDRGWHVTVCNRNILRAEALQAELPTLEILAWEDRCPHGFDVVVNGTSLGMSPNENQTPLEFEGGHVGLVVFDTVYTPEMTLLLRSAKEAGARIATGREMFYRQAALQHSYWFGGFPPSESMEDILAQL
jgi:3-dehydroquinate dehydratase / shikimate dehydrogenase